MARRSFGTVRKLASGRWQARYRDAAGTRHTAPATFTTKTQAQRWLSATETDLARGDWHDPALGRMPLAEWADRWLATKTPTLRPATAVQYETLVRRHIVASLGDIDVGDLTTLDVQGWLADLHRGHLGPNSVAKCYRLLKQLMDGAVEAGLIRANPCRLRGAGTEHADEMRVATPEEVQALVEAVDDRWKALVLTAAYSGLRWGELTGLRRRGVSPDGTTLTVTGQLSEVKNKIELDAAPKTAAGKRTVTLPEVVAAMLVEHLDRFTEPESSALVFTSPEGEPLRRNNFRRRVWHPAVKKVGLEGLRFHDLRHTGSTLAAATGAPLRAIMARLGHATPAAALRYQHVVAGQDADIAANLNHIARRALREDQ